MSVEEKIAWTIAGVSFAYGFACMVLWAVSLQ